MRSLGLVLLGILGTGVLLPLALPGGEQHYLGWVCAVPVLAAIRGRGFLVGFVCAILSVFFGAFVAQLGIYYPDRNSDEGNAWLWTGFGLFGFAFAFVGALFADKNADRKPVWWFAAWAAVFEACLLIQLPAHLALTQYRHPIAMMIASIGGVWLVTYAVWAANLWIARRPLRDSWKPVLAIIGLAFATSFIPWRDSDPTTSVIAIQCDVNDEEEFLALHRKAADKNPWLIVWPEFAGILYTFAGDTAKLQELSAQAPFVTSFGDNQPPMQHNTAALFADGKESKRYWKRKLFGAETKMFAPGSQAIAVPFQGKTVGLNICYDSCFPHVMRETTALGADVLTLPTNDPPASHNFNARMHAAYTTFRAAELGTPIIRADSLAYSMIIDSRGAIVAESNAKPGLLEAKINLGAGWRPAKLGDWALYGSGTFVLIGGFRRLAPLSAPTPPQT